MTKMLSPTNKILFVSFLDLLGVGLILPQLQNQARQLGCSHVVIGAMGAMYSGSQLVSGPVTGNISDMKGRKSVLLLTLILSGGAYLLLGLTDSIILFFMLRCFLGLGMSVGPMISGNIVEAFPDSGFKIIGCTVAGIFAINAYIISLLPNIEKSGNKSNKSKQEKRNTKEMSTLPLLVETLKNSFKESIQELKKVKWSVYWDVFLYKLIITFSIGMYFSNYGLYLKVVHQMSPKYLGYTIAFQGAIGSFCTYFIDYINRKFYENDKDASQRNLHVFIIITMSFIAMGLAPNIYLYILFVVPLAVSGAIGRVSGLEMIMNKGQDDYRGSVIGATGSVRSLSGVVTPIMTGVISEYIGVPYVIYFAALFSAVGIAVSYKIRIYSLSQSHNREKVE